MATAAKIAVALGLVLTRVGELPADRPGVSRTNHAAISIGTVGDGEGCKAVAIRPAWESDGTDFEWVLCVSGEPAYGTTGRREVGQRASAAPARPMISGVAGMALESSHWRNP